MQRSNFQEAERGSNLNLRPDLEYGAVFSHIYRYHYRFVISVACRYGASPANLEDIAQHVFVVVYRRFPEFEFRGSIKTWLYRITRNVTLSEGRKQNQLRQSVSNRFTTEDLVERERFLESRLSEEMFNEVIQSDYNPEQTVAWEQQIRQIEQMLSSYGPSLRETFFRWGLNCESGPEIAQAMDVPLSTVHSRIRLIRKYVKRSFPTWTIDE